MVAVVFLKEVFGKTSKYVNQPRSNNCSKLLFLRFPQNLLRPQERSFGKGLVTSYES